MHFAFEKMGDLDRANLMEAPFVGRVPAVMAIRIAIKSSLFFLRGYLDRMYALLLYAESNEYPGRHASMSSALKNPANPIARLLSDERPGWLDWFRAFRELRNEVKEGVNFAVGGAPTPAVRAHFMKFPSGGAELDQSDRGTVTIETLITAVNRAGELAGLLAERAARRVTA